MQNIFNGLNAMDVVRRFDIDIDIDIDIDVKS